MSANTSHQKDKLFVDDEKILTLKWGKGDGRKTRNLYLKREPGNEIDGDSGPLAAPGEARIKARYGNVLNFEGEAIDFDGAPEIDFSDADSIQAAMQAHPDVATLLFLSLPALGDIAGSSQAAEPAVVALVADDTAAVQAKVDAAERIAADLQKELDAAKASAEAALKAKDDECTQALLEESTKYSEALREKEEEISGIVGEKIKMQDEIDKLKEQLAASGSAQADQTIDRLKAQLDAAKEALEEKEQECVDAAIRVNEARKQAEFIAKAEKLELNNIIDQLKAQLAAAGGVMDVQGIANLANTNLDSKGLQQLRPLLQKIREEKETVEKAAAKKKREEDQARREREKKEAAIAKLKQRAVNLMANLIEKMRYQSKFDRQITVVKAISSGEMSSLDATEQQNLSTADGQIKRLKDYQSNIEKTLEPAIEKVKEAQEAVGASMYQEDVDEIIRIRSEVEKHKEDIAKAIEIVQAKAKKEAEDKAALAAKEAEDKRLAAEAEAKKEATATYEAKKENLMQRAEDTKDKASAFKVDDAADASSLEQLEKAVGMLAGELQNALDAATEAGVTISTAQADTAALQTAVAAAMEILVARKTAIEEQKKAKPADDDRIAQLLAHSQQLQARLDQLDQQDKVGEATIKQLKDSIAADRALRDQMNEDPDSKSTDEDPDNDDNGDADKPSVDQAKEDPAGKSTDEESTDDDDNGEETDGEGTDDDNSNDDDNDNDKDQDKDPDEDGTGGGGPSSDADNSEDPDNPDDPDNSDEPEEPKDSESPGGGGAKPTGGPISLTMDMLVRKPSPTQAKSVTSLLGLTSGKTVTGPKFLQALNMPIADIEREFPKIGEYKRKHLAKVLGADDPEPATLIRKLKQLRNIKDTSVPAAIEDSSSDSSSDSDGGDLSDPGTVVQPPDVSDGASKQAEPVKKLSYAKWVSSTSGQFTKGNYGTTEKAKAAKKAAWEKYKTS